MPITFTEMPMYYKDAQGNYHRILSGADMTGYRTAAAQDAIDAGLVSAAAAQTLTNAQQAQARNNIGAIDAGSIATIESSPATQAHAAGDYIVYNGQLYKVTAAIAAGESLVSGTNVESTTVGDQFNIRTGTYTLDSGISLTSYGIISVYRCGKLVSVSGVGVENSQSGIYSKGINVPWKANGFFITTGTNNCYIRIQDSTKVIIDGTANTDTRFQIMYFTNDP